MSLESAIESLAASIQNLAGALLARGEYKVAESGVVSLRSDSETGAVIPVKVKAGKIVASNEENPDAVDYASVKSAILEVAKKKGRDASLDVLAAFGVVKGEGKERAGNISSLTEDQYEMVVEAAKKALA